MTAITLNELAKRLSEIIEQNRASGWSDRNDLPVVVSVQPPPRKYRQHRRNAKHYPLRYASSAMTGLTDSSGQKLNVVELITNEHEAIN